MDLIAVSGVDSEIIIATASDKEDPMLVSARVVRGYGGSVHLGDDHFALGEGGIDTAKGMWIEVGEAIGVIGAGAVAGVATFIDDIGVKFV